MNPHIEPLIEALLVPPLEENFQPPPQEIEFEPEIISQITEKIEQIPKVKLENPPPAPKAPSARQAPSAEPSPEAQAETIMTEAPISTDKFVADFLRAVERSKFYPAKARREGLTGTVKVRVTFDRQGRVGPVTLIDGDYPPELGQAALETMSRAARRWSPRDGAPEVMVVPIGFRLK
jgi:TonB family protein